MLTKKKIQKNLEMLQNRISAISSKDVDIIAVTKGFPIEIYQVCKEININKLGENKVQELKEKSDFFSSTGNKFEMHYIGHLQTNKIKYLKNIIDSIDSLTSLKQMNMIKSVWKNKSIVSRSNKSRLSVLLQINTTLEEQKFGIRSDDWKSILSLAQRCICIEGISLEGIMTIGPTPSSPKEIHKREYQNRTAKCFRSALHIKAKMEKELGLKLPRLSMGMSHDFEIAIQEGSTEIRIGSYLFGQRES